MISIVVPVFNNAASIGILVDKIHKTFDAIDSVYEIVIVNDGSTDNFKSVLSKNNTGNFRVIDLDKNYGQVPAIFIGINNIKGKACVIMSADMQEPVELIPKMIEKWAAGYDLIVARRIKREDGFWNSLLSSIFYTSLHLVYKKIPIGGYDFGLIDKTIICQIKKTNPFIVFLQIRLFKFSHSPFYLDYIRKVSAEKKTTWRIKNKIKYASLALHEIDEYIYMKLCLVNILLIAGLLLINNITLKIISFGVFFFILLFSIIIQISVYKQSKRDLPKVQNQL